MRPPWHPAALGQPIRDVYVNVKTGEIVTMPLPRIDLKYDFTARSVSSGHIYGPESAIVFLARDRALPRTLVGYRTACKDLDADERQVIAVSRLIERVTAYQHDHPDLVKVADVPHGPLGNAIVEGRDLDKVVGRPFDMGTPRDVARAAGAAGLDLRRLCDEVAGAAAGVFMQRHPADVMPSEDLTAAVDAVLRSHGVGT